MLPVPGVFSPIGACGVLSRLVRCLEQFLEITIEIGLGFTINFYRVDNISRFGMAERIFLVYQLN